MLPVVEHNVGGENELKRRVKECRLPATKREHVSSGKKKEMKQQKRGGLFLYGYCTDAQEKIKRREKTDQ